MKCVLLSRPKDGSASQKEYLEEKYARFYAGNNENAGNVLATTVSAAPPIAPEKDHPELPEVILTKIKRGTDCVLKGINNRFSLRDGEVVQSDFFSYLTEPFDSYPKDTVVLTRKTNLGEFYILLPDVKVDGLHDDKSGVSLVQIYDDGRPLYPIPPKEPVELHEGLKAANSAYAITKFRVVSKTQIEFGWSLPDNPYDNKEWWALYTGVMPPWSYLSKYENWDWICPKNSNYGSTGTQTVTVNSMSSGAIYTFALFKYEWYVVDYQQFNAP